jgi:tRNA uridine 5-carboxymethylaminomethyl modification enzyme
VPNAAFPWRRPRLDASTINFDGLEGQPSDEVIAPFSYLNEGREVDQKDNLVTCYKTYTTEVTHQIVRDSMHLLPAYESGEGKGAGPR